ncbi:MAG: cupin domain-containing protein [Lachnospiraceae bacterium]|nr:cupin domain-containing protein [Lachnospiraceae bacterium]
MIRKKDECKKDFKEHMRDGKGTVEITNFITGAEELCGKGRLFSRITLKSGCSIGFHMHEKESELFYILSGTAEYNDNGEIKTVTAGDVTICPPGTGHGIENCSDETVELVALIVYAE